MTSLKLFLYSRQHCCLCEGLEERLRTLQLTELCPPVELLVIDIDQVDTPKAVRDIYDSEVPVMTIVFREENLYYPLRSIHCFFKLVVFLFIIL